MALKYVLNKKCKAYLLRGVFCNECYLTCRYAALKHYKNGYYIKTDVYTFDQLTPWARAQVTLGSEKLIKKEVSMMNEKAIEKITKEMNNSPSNAYVQYIGGALIKHLRQSLNDIGKIMNEEKTIAKSLQAMRKEAEKHRIGNCAMLTPEQGLEIVYKYFGIGTKVSPQSTQPTAPKENSGVKFDLKLEDLL